MTNFIKENKKTSDNYNLIGDNNKKITLNKDDKTYLNTKGIIKELKYYES